VKRMEVCCKDLAREWPGVSDITVRAAPHSLIVLKGGEL
jgi:hypothetical protein